MHPSRYIALCGNVRIRSSEVRDEAKPKTLTTFCDFMFRKDGLVTIPVIHFQEDGVAPTPGSVAFCSGEFFFPPGDSDGYVQASQLDVLLAPEQSEAFALVSPTVWAVGTVATVIGRDWAMDVAIFDRASKSMKTFQVIVTVPNTPRHAKLKMPSDGSSVAVRGILAYISVAEDVAAVELESVTFLPRGAGAVTTDPDSSSSGESKPSVGRSKRQLRSEKLDTGRPMKKTKSGPPEAFTPEELASTSASAISEPSGVTTRARNK